MSQQPWASSFNAGMTRSSQAEEAYLPPEAGELARLVNCNICGWQSFATGPGGRLSATGLPPRCERCQSLERHRSLRQFYNKVRLNVDTSRWACLQISQDLSVLPEWFASHAVSIYNAEHSLDIQSLPLASKQFDCVICNHVLEHVENDIKSIVELFRILNDVGFLQIGVPDPVRQSQTRDWGFPKQSEHGHYRIYGSDIVTKFYQSIRKAFLLQIRESDPATGMEDIYFLLTRSNAIVNILRKVYPEMTGEWIDCDGRPESIPNQLTPTFSDDDLKPRVVMQLHSSTSIRDPSRYISYFRDGGHASVQGWVTEGALSAVTAFSAFQRANGVNGHICEIGVHHGRFAIALSLLRKLGEKTLAIDVFEQQDLNVDQSGKGDFAIFMRNVENWLGIDHDVKVLKQDSLSVKSEQILARLQGPVRIFSVDGSHTCEHTLNDICLAAEVLTPGGIVIVDDFLNPAWPGVVEAVVEYLKRPSHSAKLVPIGYGDNKFYFTTPRRAEGYRKFIDEVLESKLTRIKKVELCGFGLTSFSVVPVERLLETCAIRPGETLFFAEGEAGVKALLYGWHKPQRLGVWSKATSATVVLTPMLEANVLVKLSITFGVAPADTDASHEIEIWCNGQLHQTASFPAEANRGTVTVDIGPDVMGSDKRVELSFCNWRPTRGKDTDSNDKRTLGLFLSSIACAPA